MNEIKKVGFIGLGVMGFPMAGWLCKEFDCAVFNRDKVKADKWIEQYQGAITEDFALLFKTCDAVVTCLRDDESLRALLIDSKVLSTMKNGALLIDHTTASETIAKELHLLAEKNQIGFLDAPVSGGESGAVNGQLTVMVGGDQQIYNKAKPILDCYSKRHVLIGEGGHGQLAKMVNQIALAGLIQGLSEALAFGEKSGIDIGRVVEAISQGAAQSWQMDNRAHTMLQDEFDFGFANELMNKDLLLCIDVAKRNNISLPVLGLVQKLYERLIQKGHPRWDTSSLINLIRDP